jgi:hypothetical protein
LFLVLEYDESDADLSLKKKGKEATQITKVKPGKAWVEDEDEYFSRKPVPKMIDIMRPCDRKAELYLLDQNQFMYGKGYTAQPEAACSR